MQKGSPSPGTTKDAPENNLKTSVSVAITENLSTAPGQNPEEDPNSALATKKRKYDTRWKQQKNLAVRQNFTVLNILILYLAIGIIFMCFGVICYLYARAYPNVLIEDYTHCLGKREYNSFGTSTEDPGSTTASSSTTESPTEECFPDEKSKDGMHPLTISKHIFCTCQVKINVDNSTLWAADNLILYFQLTHFHQNIRRYKKDVDWDQLAGRAVVNGKPASTKCKYPYYNETNKKYVFPCGKVANSYFSDVYEIFDGKGHKVKLQEKGISWASDKHRFKNPNGIKNLEEIRTKFDLPRDWHDGLKMDFLNDTGGQPAGVENEHFIVWMRPAALSNFRKKYAYIPPLEPGEYTMQIQYQHPKNMYFFKGYEVKSYKGTKKFIIAADYKDRPKDFFFFNVYVFVGTFCLLFGPFLYAINWLLKARAKRKAKLEKPDSSSDPQQTTTTTDTESGRSSLNHFTTTEAPPVTSSEHPSTSGGSTKSFFGHGR